MASEVANALWHKVKLGQVEEGIASIALAALSDMPVHWNDDDTIGAEAVRLALALGHPIYDCVYLALTHRIGAVMLTADSRFANAIAATEHGASLLTLTDYTKAR